VGIKKFFLIPIFLKVMTSFQSAQRIWSQQWEGEMNISLGFSCVLVLKPKQKITLRLTAASIYRVFWNGVFAGYGPARAAHGYARIDELQLVAKTKGKNVLAIEVAGYCVNSFYTIDESPFLQAEVIHYGKVLAVTGTGEAVSFRLKRLDHRLQYVQRYSYQRPFSEVYRLTRQSFLWRFSGVSRKDSIPLKVLLPLCYLPRRVNYPEFQIRDGRAVSRGRMKKGRMPEVAYKDRSLTMVGRGQELKGFVESELESIPSLELQAWKTEIASLEAIYLTGLEREELRQGDFILWDFGTNLTGFITSTLLCRTSTKVLIFFDEFMSEHEVDFKRLDCVNIVSYELAPGYYDLESFEPYTLRYGKVLVVEGACEIVNFRLREYVNPDSGRLRLETPVLVLKKIFQAAEETYRQNTLDTLMDCPSRERAGWLNDSFFSARAAYLFSGHTQVETTFLENFLLAPELAHLPKGLLPMCYPADFAPGSYMSNLPCWLICQMVEYRERGGDEGLIAAFQEKVTRYLSYLASFKNEFGLLENLPGCVFVEWSRANDWVRDVNTPANLMFVDALEAASLL
jgi:alpha-L-rhamnosidase